MSGESFGGQKDSGLGGRKAADSGARGIGKGHRETIGETFLEDDESELHESGEIDPRLFRWILIA